MAMHRLTRDEAWRIAPPSDPCGRQISVLSRKKDRRAAVNNMPLFAVSLCVGTSFVGSSPMTLIMAEDEVLSAAIAGVPKVAEFIAAVPTENRVRALDAAEKSYLKTAHTIGYQDAEAQQWVSAVMSRLRIEESSYKLRMLASAPTSLS